MSTAGVQRTESRVEAILSGAARVFGQKGFAATTMREVVAETGASLGSIYHHFGSKDGILREILCGNFRRVLDSIEQVFAQQQAKLLEDDALDLDVQIEVLQKQLQQERVT